MSVLAKKIIGLFAVLCVASCWSSVSSQDVEAASKASFSYVQEGQKTAYNGDSISNYFKYPKLEGTGKAVNKINSALNKEAKKHVNAYDMDEAIRLLTESASYRTYAENYLHTVKSKVTFNKKGVFSVREKSEWYQGGVYNCNYYGDTFSLKNGKRLKVTDVVAKKYAKPGKLRKALYKKIMSKYGNEAATKFRDNYRTNKKIKKMEFYISSSGKVVICFDTYELLYGAAGCLKVSIPSRY